LNFVNDCLFVPVTPVSDVLSVKPWTYRGVGFAKIR